MADDLTVGLAVVQAILVFVLVTVTGYYAWCTHRIVKESTKDRQIRRIEKALEKFYLPLLELEFPVGLDKYPYPHDYMERRRKRGDSISSELKAHAHSKDESREFWSDVISHQYLAESESMDSLLTTFLQKSEYYWVRTITGKDEWEKAGAHLIQGVKKDIEILEGRLRKLHG